MRHGRRGCRGPRRRVLLRPVAVGPQRQRLRLWRAVGEAGGRQVASAGHAAHQLVVARALRRQHGRHVLLGHIRVRAQHGVQRGVAIGRGGGAGGRRLLGGFVQKQRRRLHLRRRDDQRRHARAKAACARRGLSRERRRRPLCGCAPLAQLRRRGAQPLLLAPRSRGELGSRGSTHPSRHSGSPKAAEEARQARRRRSKQ
mmetsp:Transcript_13740/g.51301  ORF Transcript_13740/g.51301 Transcript_13740/m.51301 type:complete len:200 (-) Transcript_13740:12-611(-)